MYRKIKWKFTSAHLSFMQPKMLAIFCWAFACGIPLFLVTATLSTRLIQENISLIDIGLFSLTILPYTLKFVFGPFIEQISVPFLTNLFGHARAWMILMMSATISCLVWSAYIDIHNGNNLTQLFIASLCAAFFAALCDTAEPELRIELLNTYELPIGSACYTNGFCLGGLVAGSGTLILAGIYNWRYAYLLTTSLMFIGLFAVIVQKHHQSIQLVAQQPTDAKLKSQLSQFFQIAVFFPIKKLMCYPGIHWMILIIIFYNVNYYLLQMMINPFYLHAGLSNVEIGTYRGVCGTIVLIIGGFIGGICCKTANLLRILANCAILYIVYLILLALIAQLTTLASTPLQQQQIVWLSALSILFVNFIDGISMVASYSLMASICKPPHTVTQNALFISGMAIANIAFSSIGGYWVTLFGWTIFFLIGILLIIPVIYCINRLQKINPQLLLVHSDKKLA